MRFCRKTKKIGIIGEDSFIGKHLYNFLSENSDYELIGTNRKSLDITDKAAIGNFLKSEKCDVIILLAGSKNVKELEQNPDLGYELNVEPVKNFVKYITSEKLIYMSSDYVFDGERGDYTITDKVSPNTVYGKNKVEAETIIQNGGINYSIIRTAAVLGKNSVFLDWLLNTLKNEKTVEMFENSYFTPTCINFLTEAVNEIINDDGNKIYHAVQEKRLSRYELALAVQKLIGTNCEIIPVMCNQTDRSLIQDNLTRNLTSKTFEEYLKEQLCV